MALSEEIEANKKLILGEARLHNTKIEKEIQHMEEEAMNIEREISYQRGRLRAIEAKIVDTRENLITITI
jgi:predicted  nucleic acid-binding Zn-ribbon protein